MENQMRNAPRACDEGGRQAPLNFSRAQRVEPFSQLSYPGGAAYDANPVGASRKRIVVTDFLGKHPLTSELLLTAPSTEYMMAGYRRTSLVTSFVEKTRPQSPDPGSLGRRPHAPSFKSTGTYGISSQANVYNCSFEHCVLGVFKKRADSVSKKPLNIIAVVVVTLMPIERFADDSDASDDLSTLLILPMFAVEGDDGEGDSEGLM